MQPGLEDIANFLADSNNFDRTMDIIKGVVIGILSVAMTVYLSIQAYNRKEPYGALRR